jgi:hypothetical protein
MHTEDLNARENIVRESLCIYREFVRSGGQYQDLAEPHMLRLSIMLADFSFAHSYLEASVFVEENCDRILKKKKGVYKEFEEHLFHLNRASKYSGVLYFVKALKSSGGDESGKVARFGGGNKVIKPMIDVMKKHLFKHHKEIDQAIKDAEMVRDKMIAHSDADAFSPCLEEGDDVSYSMNDLTIHVTDDMVEILKTVSYVFTFILSDMMEYIRLNSTKGNNSYNNAL